jgi:hypothetical protein
MFDCFMIFIKAQGLSQSYTVRVLLSVPDE